MERFLLGCLVGIPVWGLVTLLHEIGHAQVALAMGADRVVVRTGGDTWSWRWGATRFEFGIGLEGWAEVRGFDEAGTAARMLHYAAGPIVSLAVGGVGWIGHVWCATTGMAALLASVVTVGGFLQFVATLLPVEYPSWFGPYAGRPSDGLRIWRLLAGESTR